VGLQHNTKTTAALEEGGLTTRHHTLQQHSTNSTAHTLKQTHSPTRKQTHSPPFPFRFPPCGVTKQHNNQENITRENGSTTQHCSTLTAAPVSALPLSSQPPIPSLPPIAPLPPPKGETERACISTRSERSQQVRRGSSRQNSSPAAKPKELASAHAQKEHSVEDNSNNTRNSSAAAPSFKTITQHTH
jgi:hypothetical protein